MKYVVFDIEVANDPNQVGWDNLSDLGVSWAVLYVSWLDRYIHYQERSLQAMAHVMAEADLLVSWNGVAFDLPLLLTTLQRLELPYPEPLDRVEHCDLLRTLERATGQKLSLNEVAQWTISQAKTGSGDMAPVQARAGCWDTLASYCEDDVRLTRRLYEFARDHGYLLWEIGRVPVSVPDGVAASTPEPVPATEKQLAWLTDLRRKAGIKGFIASISKAQARVEIDALLKRLEGAP